MKHLGPVARTVLDLGGFMAKQQEGKFWKICYSNKLQGKFTFTPCLFLQMFKFVYACISWEDLRWHMWMHFCGFNLCNWLWRTGLVQKGLGLSVSCDWIKGEWGWNGRSRKSVAVNHVWTKCAHAPLHKWTGEGERANICISHAGVWGGSLIQLIQIGAAAVVLMKREKLLWCLGGNEEAPFATVLIGVYDQDFDCWWFWQMAFQNWSHQV